MFPTSPLTIAILVVALTASLALVAWIRWLFYDPFPYIDGPPTSNLLFGHVSAFDVVTIISKPLQFPDIMKEEVGIAYVITMRAHLRAKNGPQVS